MREITKYVSDLDGKEFESRADCETREAISGVMRVLNDIPGIQWGSYGGSYKVAAGIHKQGLRLVEAKDATEHARAK